LGQTGLGCDELTIDSFDVGDEFESNLSPGFIGRVIWRSTNTRI